MTLELNRSQQKLDSGELDSVIVIAFEGDDVHQLIEGKIEVFSMIGAVEVLKQDLLNQCDTLKKGELA